jgi:hypothetical protein
MARRILLPSAIRILTIFDAEIILYIPLNPPLKGDFLSRVLTFKGNGWRLRFKMRIAVLPCQKSMNFSVVNFS